MALSFQTRKEYFCRMRIAWICGFLFWGFMAKAQQGVITGNAVDEKNKVLENATVQLISFIDSTQNTTVTTDKTGFFTISSIDSGYYKLRISYVSLQPLIIDSIYFRPDRFDFNLGDLVL